MAFTVDPNTGRTTDPTGQSLDTNQHAGGGPDLTGSGLDLGSGKLNYSDPAAGMVLGEHQTSTDTGNGNINFGTELIRATFDKVISWRLRHEPMYKQFATVRAIRETAYPGSKVTMFRTGAEGLGLAKVPLSEYADPDAVALPGLEDKLDVTVEEYGNSTVVTSRIKRYSWADIDPMQAEYVARNLRDTVDATYMESVYSTDGGWLGGGFRQAVTLDKDNLELTGNLNMGKDKMFDLTRGTYGPLMTDDTKRGGDQGEGAFGLTASHVRRIVAHFRSLGVRPMADGYYVALITPEIALQLREDSATEGANGWRYPHLDGSWNGSILNGTVGVFEGVRFIEGAQFKGLEKGGEVPEDANSILQVAPDNSSGTDTHNVLFLGSEGICDVIVEDPHTVVTPTTDKFGRLQGLGWIGTWGSQVYDNNAGLLVSVKV